MTGKTIYNVAEGLFVTQKGTVRIEVLYESETFWLNQKKIVEFFGVELPSPPAGSA